MASTKEDRVPEPEVWTARLRDFVMECVDSPACDEAARIREAALLLQGGAAAGVGITGIDPVTVEAMLACGAAESAVLSMLSPDAVFMLSRGQGNSCLATVIVGEGGDEVISEGTTLALSLLAAYGAALLSGLDARNDEAEVRFTHGITRLH